MSSKTYKTRVLVLRKTKLGEKDLIVTMLDKSGALVRGVAKGARKPGGSLAARLELFSTADVLLAHGRTLDVVCEARLVDGGLAPMNLEALACAAPIAELLAQVAQPGLEQPRMFDLTRAAFAQMSIHRDDPGACLSLCAATLWKVMAQAGFRPSLDACSVCGAPVENESGSVAFSLVEGGVACPHCPRSPDAIMVDARTVGWCKAIIMSRFDAILSFEVGTPIAFDVLHLARLWIRAYTGRELKSLDFLFTSGLF